MCSCNIYLVPKYKCLKNCEETEYIVIPETFPLDSKSTCQLGSFHLQHFEHAFGNHFSFQSYKALIEGKSIDDLAKSFANGTLCQQYVESYVGYVRSGICAKYFLSFTQKKTPTRENWNKLSIYIWIFEWLHLHFYQTKPFSSWKFGKIGALVNFIIQKLKSKHLWPERIYNSHYCNGVPAMFIS